MIDPDVPVTFSAEIMQFMTGSKMDRVESFSRYLPFTLIIAVLFINFGKIRSSFQNMRAGIFYPILLCLEFTMWPVLFSVITGELMRYLCYLPVYSAIVYYLWRVRTDQYKKYFAVLYMASSMMVMVNIIAFLIPGIPIIQAFYNLWPEIMSSISIGMTLIGLRAMYGNGGSGGTRINSKHVYNDHVRTMQNDLA